MQIQSVRKFIATANKYTSKSSETSRIRKQYHLRSGNVKELVHDKERPTLGEEEADDDDCVEILGPGPILISEPTVTAKKCLCGSCSKSLIASTSENSYFRSVIRQAYAKNRFLYVPKPFATKYLMNLNRVTLLAPNGRVYLVDLYHAGAFGTRITRGWSEFLGDNNLKEGSVCFFELIRRMIFC
ncbi:hypothetical protein GIB67_007080 [Kingdonia uniflora]|uniref:TF-B3 domain-containing protein n=1 Tax=Kingdonia uniflora TaxID=39325 RepID=A0A7J7NZG0_9MAGN|nr:hypothetical protein GIB67_007080 [Kingdonia uniflora]